MREPEMRRPEMRDLDALMQDKLEVHCRQQLSSMLDGALAPDQARFLLRRLQHDHELAGCWERWQVYGDLMRGGVPALLPADFSQRVQAGLAGQDAAQQRMAAGGASRPSWAGWAGGAALAASVAVAALFVSQRAPVETPPVETAPAGSGAPLAATSAAGPTQTATQPVRTQPVRVPAPTPSKPGPAAPDAAGAVAATALAAAEVPRRVNARRERASDRSQVNRRASAPARASAPNPMTTGAEAPILVAAAADPAPAANHAATAPVPNLFVDEAIAPARPWPRPILPGMSGNTFTVDYGANAADGDFDYFEPRLPAEPSSQ